jgi:predicted ATPase
MSVGVVSPVFIGRREEVASATALIGRAQAGEPAFVLIFGEAGVRKTRLVSELTARASGAGFLVLTGQCVELGAEGLPLAPLVDALRTRARTMVPDALAEVLGPAGPGLAPNTLSNNAGPRSPASATVRELHKHHPSEHW